MTIYNEIKYLASQMSNNTTRYFDCPACNKLKKFGITKTYNGIVYNCFSASCNLKGKSEGTPTKEDVLNLILRPVIEEKHQFVLPDYLIDGFASENSVKMALKYNLLGAYSNGLFKTSFDPKLNRQVFYYLDKDGKICGATGRGLLSSIKPKSHIYQHSHKTLQIVGTNKDVIVLVEDFFSAVQIYNAGYTGASLSGTTWIEGTDLKEYKRAYVALDKDATIKSFIIRNNLKLQIKDVEIVLINKDFKDSTIEEIRKIII